ncbi:MAG: LAGLIDADG family homing endonuclease, partial [Bacteroidales bacterium]|nr:LAGLIDADG family homing endonuclease [Bacteroidales bacterium]
RTSVARWPDTTFSVGFQTEIIAIPEPRRSDYVAESSSDIDKFINKTIKDFIKKNEKLNEKLFKHRIVIYHGEVKGAVYQNGVSASSSTAISKELLQSLNAEYYALGHIHMPQEIFPNAWYPGSACPKNFGETHDGHYNLVTIEEGNTKVEQVSFGLPWYVTFYERPDNFIEGNPHQNENANIRFVFDCTKEERKQMNIKAYADEIKERLRALSVKIEPNVIESDTVPVSEVSKRKSIVEKMTEYVKEKQLKMPKYAKELLQDIEDNTLAKLAYPQHSFELLSLSLRGAIGIRDGQHKEDFELNFETMEDGVVCLCGNSGRGKCITGDSLILSNNGFEIIGSYDNKKMGFTPFKKQLYSERNNIAESSHFYAEEVSKTIKIENSIGMELEGTPEHPVLVFMPDCTYQFKKLSEITTDDYVCIPRGMNVFSNEHYKFSFKPFIWRATKNIKTPIEMNTSLAKFLGYYIANGSHTNNCIQFSTKNEIIAKDYINCVQELFNIEVELPTGKSFNYRIYSSVVKQFLEYIFNSELTTGRYKTIPACILQGTQEEQRAFITAIFDCDASLCKNIFEFSSASKQVVFCLQNMLLNFGIISSLKKKKVKGYDWVYYRLVISSLGVDNLFYKVLKNSKKYNYTRSVDANTNIDVIPYIPRVIREKIPVDRSGKIKSVNGKKYLNPFVNSILQKRKNISYGKLDTLISLSLPCNAPEVKEINKLLRDISAKFYFYSKVKSIEYINEPKIVYDFTIPTTHRFYSNGYISHNSTLIENCHPYPCMLTREGTLKDHFYLKDSHRILIYKDENGLFYKISILIDGKTATGKTSYFVETSKDRESWKSVPDVDGSSDAYKKWVDSTFGSIDVFLRTAFFAKEQTKGTPDISVTTKSERMELLSKLAGTEHLKEVSLVAKDKRKEMEKSISKLSDEVEDSEYLEEDIEENEKAVKAWNKELEKTNTSITSLETEIAALRIKDTEYQKSKALAEANKALYDQYQKQFEEKQKTFEEYDDALSSYETIEKIAEYKKLSAENKKKIPEFQKKIRDKRDEVSKKTEELNKLLKEKDKQRKEYNRLSTEIKLVEQQIVPISDVCPTCGAKLSDKKYAELNQTVEENKKKLDELTTERCKYIVEDDDKDWNIVPVKSKIDELNKEISNLDIALMEMIDTSDSAESFIESYSELEKFSDMTKDEIEEKSNTLKAEAQELDQKMDNIIYEDCAEDVTEELKEKEQELKDATDKKSELAALIKSAEKENEKYRKELKASESKRKELKELEAKVTAYNFIEDAFSNNGIPAIELRESAPEIADITNKILKESYGSKFEIRFGSTNELKTNRKANEDFNILVYDSENDDEKTIDLVSSGEKIWIKQALFYALSIVQMNRTGFNFRTRLIDESDGSLV